MKKLGAALAALVAPLALAACGGGSKTTTVIQQTTPSTASSSTASSTPTTDTSSTDTGSTDTTSTDSSSSGAVTPVQKAELKAGATCLVTKAKRIKGNQQYGQPAIEGFLKSGNVIALVMYGDKGGAGQGERKIEKAYPKFDAYHSPNDRILIFYGKKVSPGSTDYEIGNTCQKAAAGAG